MSTYYELGSCLVCPFCGEKDFDAWGLQNHLHNHCEIFRTVECSEYREKQEEK